MSRKRGEPANLDLEALHQDYRTGQYSWGELSRKYGVDPQTIRYHVKKQGWTKDLEPKIREAEEAAKAARMIPTDVAITNDKLIEIIVDSRVRATLRHMARNQRLTDSLEKLHFLVEEWLSGDKKRMAKAAETLFPTKGDSLTGHLRTIGALTEALQKLERQNLGMKDIEPPPDPPKPPVIDGEGNIVDPTKALSTDELLALRGIADAMARRRPTSAKN